MYNLVYELAVVNKTGHTNINNQTTEGAKLSLYCFGVRYPRE